MVPLGRFTTPVQAPSMTIPLVIGVNPLQTTWLERGIVSGRVALLLRSAEIHPLFERFVDWRKPVSPPSLSNSLQLSPTLSPIHSLAGPVLQGGIRQ